jgi:hypothetical protein
MAAVTTRQPDGEWPNGKAARSGREDCRFDSCLPSTTKGWRAYLLRAGGVLRGGRSCVRCGRGTGCRCRPGLPSRCGARRWCRTGCRCRLRFCSRCRARRRRRTWRGGGRRSGGGGIGGLLGLCHLERLGLGAFLLDELHVSRVGLRSLGAVGEVGAVRSKVLHRGLDDLSAAVAIEDFTAFRLRLVVLRLLQPDHGVKCGHRLPPQRPAALGAGLGQDRGDGKALLSASEDRQSGEILATPAI